MNLEPGVEIGVWQLAMMASSTVFVLLYFVPTVAVLRTRIGKRRKRIGFILWTLFGIVSVAAIGIGQFVLIDQLGLVDPDPLAGSTPLRELLALTFAVVVSIMAYVYFRQLARRTYDAGLERWVAYMAALNPLALPFVIVFLFFRGSRRTARPHLLT